MIIFMGVAGAGKSVQGRLLADDLGYRWLSTGEYLRAHISGERRKQMLAGKLLNDQEIIEILSNYFDSLKEGESCVVDGFPRTIPQAEWLLDRHQTTGPAITAVVYLDVSLEVVKERLLARGRQDDTEEAITRRFEEFESATLPILDWFKKQSIPVYEVNGERAIEDIHTDIMNLVEPGAA